MKKPLLVSAVVVLTVGLAVSAVGAAGLNRSSDEIALWNGPSAGLGSIVYTIDLDRERSGAPIHRVFEGIDIGSPTFLFSDRHVFDGLDRAKRQFTFSVNGQRIYEGENETGELLYFLQRTGRFIRVHRGANTTGTILYTFTRNRVYDGPNTQGSILLSTDRDFFQQEAPVVQVVTILLEMAPSLGEPDSVGSVEDVSLSRSNFARPGSPDPGSRRGSGDPL